MASQAAIFAETIAGMKRAVRRQDYDSDSDSSIEALTNRGNKLKRKARYVHQGQLAPPNGPPVYKRKINHAGFDRYIISQNPPLVDEEGYEVDSEDDDERAQAALASAVEFDPYADVKIEYLLAPLTSAADLPNHPTLSKPFHSKTLTDLTRQAGIMVQKERASLWRIKHLLTRLSGDNTWIPCESVETENDFALFTDERDRHRDNRIHKLSMKEHGDHVSVGTIVSDDAIHHIDVPRVADSLPNIAQGTIEARGSTSDRPVEGHTEKELEENDTTSRSEDKEPNIVGAQEPLVADPAADGNSKADADGFIDPDATLPLDPMDPNEAEDADELDGQEDNPAPHRMRTRAQAQAVTDTATSRTRSMTPDSNYEPPIHPYFLAPGISHPDRDLGLPQQEAEETRRLLQLYIQKQEEVCRGAQRVYEGLLKAERYRHLVYKWAKAEAHVGVNRDMSDGEDWYDPEEWGLDEPLKKGENEEDEDPQTQAKKTRTRRQ